MVHFLVDDFLQTTDYVTRMVLLRVIHKYGSIGLAAYNKLNSFVAFTAQWSVNYNLSFQVSGTWNTLYDQKNTIQYRNLLIFHVSAAFSF